MLKLREVDKKAQAMVSEAERYIENNLPANYHKNFQLAIYCKAFNVSYKFLDFETGGDFIEASMFIVSDTTFNI